MTPASDRRKLSIFSIIFPALVGLLGVLVALGVTNVLANQHSLATKLDNLVEKVDSLREDVAAMKAHGEDKDALTNQRLARLEDDKTTTKPIRR